MIMATPSPRSPYGTKYRRRHSSWPYVSPKPATTYTTSCTSHNVSAFAVAIGVFRENKGRSWRRAARIAAMRYVLGTVQNALDLKFWFGVTTAEIYATWARNSGADVLTDELSEGAALHWIGPRQKDRVFLFLHGTRVFPHFPTWMLIGRNDPRGRLGGAYIIPARFDYLYMLESIRKEYKGAVGIAMLNYCTPSCDM